MNSYQEQIVQYYNSTEHAYKDAWDLDNSLAIHYGYWDKKVNSFPGSLQRMNEVMADRVDIGRGDKVLDAGCGVGGSAIYLALSRGCTVTGITLSEKQASRAGENAAANEVDTLVDFQVMNYTQTSFPDSSFDVVWGCESICYAEDKEKFVKEAWRLLKPGGRLVVADGFVHDFQNNHDPVIRNWLDGWQVNYLETPERFRGFMENAGFSEISYTDITRYTRHSSRRLYKFYFLASLYVTLRKISFAGRATDMQKKNIKACKYQYYGMKKRLWEYGLISGRKV